MVNIVSDDGDKEQKTRYCLQQEISGLRINNFLLTGGGWVSIYIEGVGTLGFRDKIPLEPVMDWLDENNIYAIVVRIMPGYRLWFTSEVDLMAFKLRWL